jgi:sodium/hydrogen antiporter
LLALPAAHEEKELTSVSSAVWCVVAGAVLVLMALSNSVLKRLPLTASMFYLALGVVLGPAVLGVLELPSLSDSKLVERVTEAAVLISLFTAGLKLRMPLQDRRWVLPVALATISMALTVGLIALLGVFVLGLSLGAAVLLGAIIAPTDPVLASDVQVSDPYDRDRLRFSLTGEAGLNDGTAFPFVMLGLGLLGLHDIGAGGWRWWSVDLVWAVAGGLAVGALLGTLVGRVVLYLRAQHREALGLDEFLALGLIALAYGFALLLHTYGFLAVLAAGVALRRIELRHSDATAAREPAHVNREQASETAGRDCEEAPAEMAQAVLRFNEQIERIAEVAVVVLLGVLIGSATFPPHTAWVVVAVLLVIRPASVFATATRLACSGEQRVLMSWFGIRGVGSMYYLAYAVQHGVSGEVAAQLTGVTLAIVATSIVVHGVSVTPLMNVYSRRR